MHINDLQQLRNIHVTIIPVLSQKKQTLLFASFRFKN